MTHFSSLSEFDIIARYFNQPGLAPDASQEKLIPLGIGDDCALLTVPVGSHLAISMDMLVADVHFPAQGDANLIAQRALSVNLSDLAAMGATPIGFTLGLSLPEASANWLQGFSDGLRETAQRHQCPLVGGDMTKGSLNICIQVHGYVDIGDEIKRSGAAVGDLVYVSGVLGKAGLALEMFKDKPSEFSAEHQKKLNQAFYQPQPRLNLGQAGLGLVSAGIDISDGLLADLGHIASRSGVGIIIELDKVPVSPIVQSIAGAEAAQNYALCAGDDYELGLTIAPQHAARLEALAAGMNIPLTCVGKVVAGAGVSCQNGTGATIEISKTGYKHF